MKKILLSMMAALFAVASFAQTAEMKQPAVKQYVSMGNVLNATPEKTPILRPVVKGLQAVASPYKLGKKRAPRRAEGEFSVEDLAGDWIQAQLLYGIDDSNYFVPETPSREATNVTIEPGANNEITIYGLLDLEYGITATVDLETFTITIPDGQVIGTSSYGDVTMVNVTSEGDIKATIYADGIEFEDYWCGVVPYNGSQARATSYYHSILLFPNAVMEYTNSRGEEVAASLAAVMDEESNLVSVFNFGNFGFCVDIELQPGNVFTIDRTQIVEDGGETYGTFSPYGYDAGANRVFTLTGTGTETKLTSDTDWTFYASSTGYWYGGQGAFTIELIDGSEFTYPDPEVGELVVLPAGLTTTEYTSSYSVVENGAFAAKTGSVKVAWDGTDVYFQGFDLQLPEAWVKGSLDEQTGVITVPVTYTGSIDNASHFFAAYGSEGEPVELVIEYDAQTNTYYSPDWVEFYAGSTSSVEIYYYGGLFLGTKPTPFAIPESAEVVDMPYAGEFYNSQATTEDEMFVERTGTVKVAKTENLIFIEGLFANRFEKDCIVGQIVENEGQKFVVFPMGEFIGELANGFMTYLLSYSYDSETSTISTMNVIFVYDEANNFLTLGTPLMLSRSSKDVNYYFEWAQPGMTIGVDPTGIDTITADLNKADGTWYNINGMRIARPTQKGLYINNGKKYVVK